MHLSDDQPEHLQRESDALSLHDTGRHGHVAHAPASRVVPNVIERVAGAARPVAAK